MNLTEYGSADDKNYDAGGYDSDGNMGPFNDDLEQEDNFYVLEHKYTEYGVGWGGLKHPVAEF